MSPLSPCWLQTLPVTLLPLAAPGSLPRASHQLCHWGQSREVSASLASLRLGWCVQCSIQTSLSASLPGPSRKRTLGLCLPTLIPAGVFSSSVSWSLGPAEGQLLGAVWAPASPVHPLSGILAGRQTCGDLQPLGRKDKPRARLRCPFRSSLRLRKVLGCCPSTVFQHLCWYQP